VGQPWDGVGQRDNSISDVGFGIADFRCKTNGKQIDKMARTSFTTASTTNFGDDLMKMLLGIAALFIVIVIGNTVIVAQENMKAPVAKKVPKVMNIHGYQITDNYAWLRDRSDKKDPEIIKYLEDNNAYTEQFMGKHQPFVDSLYKEMLGRIKQTDTSVPYEKNGWWYFNTTKEAEQYPRYFRSKTKDLKDPQLLLDQNEMAKGFKFFAIGDFSVSDDGNLLAYTTDTTG
jgi:oligopeptidase B